MKKFIKIIPNILTIIRFIFIPFIVLSIAYNNYILALVLFTVSSLSDVLDGYIARKFNAISDFGKLMDNTNINIVYTIYKKNHSYMDINYINYKRVSINFRCLFLVW